MVKFIKEVAGYKILDPVGNPQESRVCVGHEVVNDRPVAIKSLPLDFFQSEREFEQFDELTRKATTLKHPNLLMPERLIGKFTEAYLVTELIDGPNLRTLVEQHPPVIGDAHRMTLQLLNVLQFLHSKNILHRNLKSTNVLIRPDKSVVVCDLFYSPLFVRWRRVKGFPSVESVRYVSPEECQEKKLVRESDVYSLGVLLYYLYTRTLPIRGQSALELQARHVKMTVRERPDMINPNVPPFVSDMILKMLVKNPRKRTGDLGELILDLRRLVGDRSGARPSGRI